MTYLLKLVPLLLLAVACNNDGQIAPADISSTDAEVTADTTPADTAEASDSTDTAGNDTSISETSDTGSADTTQPDTSISETTDTGSGDTGGTGDTGTGDTGDTRDTSISETSDTDTTNPTCPDGAGPGDRFAAGDHCNACECQANGSASCTARACDNEKPGCDYDGVAYAYGERFPSTDRCNVCVCAASGLACTRRCSGLPEEGAILVEDMDAPCGETLAFTANNVLAELPSDDITAPFVYNRTSTFYPETRPDTSGRLRITYEGGFVVCRIPSPEQPAFDIEVSLEWMTGDGAFDEGIHTYLRKNGFGFVDAWYVLGSWAHGALDGDYDSTCLDPSGYSFSAQVDRDGTTSATMFKTCETDIGLQIGSMETDVTP